MLKAAVPSDIPKHWASASIIFGEEKVVRALKPHGIKAWRLSWRINTTDKKQPRISVYTSINSDQTASLLIQIEGESQKFIPTKRPLVINASNQYVAIWKAIDAGILGSNKIRIVFTPGKN